MSNRSFPADFSRPLRETPVATEADIQRMLERLCRRCKVGKVSVDLAPASSADPQSAGGLHVSAIAEKTACAGGGPHETVPSSPPFQPTRSAPIVWERISPTAMRTTCGTWTCAKVIVGGYPRYELWKRIAGLECPVCIKRGMTAFLEAQEMAEADEH